MKVHKFQSDLKLLPYQLLILNINTKLAITNKGKSWKLKKEYFFEV